MDPMILLAIKNILTIASNDEDEDDVVEEEEYLLLLVCLQRNRQSICPRVRNFMGIIRVFDDTEFSRHFRVNRETFEFILRLIACHISRQGRMGRHPIHPEIQLLLTLWIMGTPDSYRSVCMKFNVGEATALRSVRRVTNALFALRSLFIQWPSPVQAAESIDRFYARKRIPGVIGAIDGMHIHILKPKRDANSYINRKGYHSIVMQSVCDHRKKFIHYYVGEVGTVHDSRVLRNSKLSRFFHERFFLNNSHLLEDKGYGISKYIITPFRDTGHLTQRKYNFNFCHSSTQMVVERTFGLLKIKEKRIFDKLYMFRTDLIPKFIMALCVLHNINIEKDNLDNLPTVAPDHRNLPLHDEQRGEGILKRNIIARRLPLQ